MATDFLRDDYNDTAGTDITSRAPAVGAGAPTIDIGGGATTTGPGGTPAGSVYFGTDAIRKAVYSVTAPPTTGVFVIEGLVKTGGAGNWRVDALVAQSAGPSVALLIHNNTSVTLSASTGGSGGASQGTFGTGSTFAWQLEFSATECALRIAADQAGLASAPVLTTCTLTGALTPDSVQVGGRDLYVDSMRGIDPDGAGSPPPPPPPPPSTYSAQIGPFSIATGSGPLLSTAVSYTLYPGVDVGAISGAPINGSGVTDVGTGALVVSGLAAAGTYLALVKNVAGDGRWMGLVTASAVG